jgi:hypothetical protein
MPLQPYKMRKKIAFVVYDYTFIEKVNQSMKRTTIQPRSFQTLFSNVMETNNFAQ